MSLIKEFLQIYLDYLKVHVGVLHKSWLLITMAGPLPPNSGPKTTVNFYLFFNIIVPLLKAQNNVFRTFCEVKNHF